MSAILLLAALLPDPEPAPANPMQSLATAIPHGIKLLEAKKHEEFITTFVPAADLAMARADPKIWKRVIDQFAGEKAAEVLTALKDIKSQKPEMSKDGTLATFKLKKELGGRGEMTFVKVGKSWWIKQ
jgi:cytochrome c556